MKLISEKKALGRLKRLKSDFKTEIVESFEHRAKSCLTCETQGACCLDAHFVNVHVSRLEAVAIGQVLARLDLQERIEVYQRIDETIEDYRLTTDGDTFIQTFACPLFEKGTGCMVHLDAKPAPCIMHACYENAADLPPHALLKTREREIDALNEQTYGRPQPWLPLPLAIRSKA